MGLAKLAVGDAAITFLWVFCMASLGATATFLASYLGVPGSGKIYLIFTLVVVLILAFSSLGKALGGASWNPTALVAFAYVGASKDTPFSLAVRLPAQMIGAVGGALSILEVMPTKYKHMLGGPKLRVALSKGVLAEGLLTFTITLVFLWTFLRGPRNGAVKSFIVIVTTIALVMLGGAYTGPAMNPANAFGWAYANNQHVTWEHFAVYWLGPMVGAVASVWVFRLLFTPLPKGGPGKKEVVKGEPTKDGLAKEKAS